jgi:DinB superfamily
MTPKQPAAEEAKTAEFLRTVLKSQYHAALAMLWQAFEKCPEDLWYRKDQANAFWQTAYHTLYFTHLYLQPALAAFKPWKYHQPGVQHEDGIAGPPDPNSKLPLLPEPYTREQVLEYWSFCDAMVDSALDAFDPLSPESGFNWYKVSKLEHQIINIRHIQLGAAQLATRLRADLNIGLEWVGTGAKARLVARQQPPSP